MSKENFKEVETIIGPSVKVEGDFNADGNVIIEGQMIGNLKTQKGLRVGEGAKIKANISAENAWVGGEIVGNINILDHLELASGAVIKGDIEAENLTVATGAKINGQIKMGVKPEKESIEE
ncbi:MAG TPA: polymer-forming cytoskeletal protein [bacterium]|nr:polymer-forming cytoskeletal protein [bacterium]HPL95714.1 polymer-forming cytoskeletal protein [bacterium]